MDLDVNTRPIFGQRRQVDLVTMTPVCRAGRCSLTLEKLRAIVEDYYYSLPT